MVDITLKSDIRAILIRHIGSDLDIAFTAWTSTDVDDAIDEPWSLPPQEAKDISPKRVLGLLNYLMKHRHGSPFEDGQLTFQVSCPIFVAREWMRHRIGWSYNEMSGRYVEMQPIFWVPREDRGLVNMGTSARPRMERGDPGLHTLTTASQEWAYKTAWAQYQSMLASGVANEVARSVLPLATYTRFRASCNPRSLMHFLSLRTHELDASFVSYPMAEIEEAARQMESALATHWPLVYGAFTANGRVGP